MSIKDNVLILLEKNKNKALSGEELAASLSCTRAAVWKAIKSLESEGYNIQAVNNKGYTLITSPDVLSEAFIKEKVKNAGFDIEIMVEDEVDSTNNVLKSLASNGKTNDCVLISASQTAGKGRRGRGFFSPKDTGIYISFLLHPAVSVLEASMLTTLAATAEALSIETVLNTFESDTKNIDSVDIKWVNDIYIRGKKVSGILTEASTSIEDGTLEYAVPGIGINIYEPEGGFPNEIKDIAGAIFKDSIKKENLRNILASELIINFLKYYTDKNDSNSTNNIISRSFYEDYKKRSIVLGKDVNLLTPDHEVISGDHSTAKVIDINEDCHLLVEYKDGEREYLSSGEISIRI